MAKKEEPKEPVDNIFKPETTFTMSLQELAAIEQTLTPFAFAHSLIANMKNREAANGAVVSTYREDYILDKEGNFVLNERGRPQLVPDFWEKYK